jgi:archaellum component FlaC
LIHDNGQRFSYGLIAQDVEKVLPDIVNTINGDDGDGIQNLKTVSYTELIPVLVKAMQEQQVIIEELQKQVEELKRRVN